MSRIPLTIIGGGVVGCAIADELSQSIDGIVLLEKNRRIPGENQSSRNSGVVHAGIYYNRQITPLKAELCPQGNKLLYEVCPALAVPIKRTGKLLMMTDQLSEEYVDDVRRVAVENGVPGVERISLTRARELEPNVEGIGALYVPSSGIVDAAALVKALSQRAQERGATLLPGNTVVEIKPHQGYFEFTTVTVGDENARTFETERLINAAGLYADEIARLVNGQSRYEIVPTRGESARFYHTRRPEMAMKGLNVYPAPYVYDSKTGEQLQVSLPEAHRLVAVGDAIKTVGIHLTPTFDEVGNIGSAVTIGPAKTVGIDKENYGDHLKSPCYFHERVRNFFPGLRVGDIELHQAGIMAVLKGHPDWIIERDARYSGMINLLGIDSPGLTACLSIARYVKELIS